jgi:hypothetical protein
MKYFTDRIFYIERTDSLAHIVMLTPEMWAISILGDRPEWIAEAVGSTYETVFNRIRYDSPLLLLQEEWAQSGQYVTAFNALRSQQEPVHAA